MNEVGTVPVVFIALDPAALPPFCGYDFHLPDTVLVTFKPPLKIPALFRRLFSRKPSLDQRISYETPLRLFSIWVLRLSIKSAAILEQGDRLSQEFTTWADKIDLVEIDPTQSVPYGLHLTSSLICPIIYP